MNNNKYGFQAHLRPEFPSQIVVDVTEFCNLTCVHCPHEEFSKSPAFGGRHLDPNLHKKLIDEVAVASGGHCKYLRYTSLGEPLLHPDFIQMMDYAVKHAKISVNVTTNGTFLIEKKARALLDTGVNVLDISLDANTPETYALVRKKGDLNITRPNVLRLIELIQNGGYKTKVVVSFVEMPLNKHESTDFKQFWENQGADYVVIRRPHSSGGVKKEMVRVDQSRYPCPYPWERLTLAADGFIHFCPQDWVRGSVVCDFRTNTIKEVWQGEFMTKLREAHMKNNFSNHGFCGDCPDWSVARWPDEGRAYTNMMQEFVSFGEANKEGTNK